MADFRTDHRRFGHAIMPRISGRTMQMQRISHRFALTTCVVLIAAGTARAGDLYVQTNLVSDIHGLAPNFDPNLMGAGASRIQQRARSGYPTRMRA